MKRLMIIGMIALMTACKSSKNTERVVTTDSVSQRVVTKIDSLSGKYLEEYIQRLIVNTQAELQREIVYYSAPDSNGEQHVTQIERTQASLTTSAEQQATQSLVNAYKRTQRTADSISSKVNKLDRSKTEAKKTSGGVFSWTGTETATILAIALLAIVAWIIAKTKGFI